MAFSKHPLYRIEGSNQLTCRDCKHFRNDPAWLEKEFRGLSALSSAYGSTRGENGVCTKQDVYLSPMKSCRDFEEIGTDREGGPGLLMP